MMIRTLRLFGSHFIVALLLIGLAAASNAQERSGRPGGGERRPEQAQQGGPTRPNQSGPGVLALLPADSVTQHSIATPAGKLDYTATAGTLSLFDQSGERSAAVFYTAYVVNSAVPGSRPVTFAFNGGPGAASAYLHLGLVGPRLAEFGQNGHDGSSVRLIDNPDTWLAFTDLVFIDPVGTGWSRAAKRDGDEAFWGVAPDAESMAKVIALYVAKNSRLDSAKFILGESYGGFRAPKVARALQSQQGISVAGILMVSPLLERALQLGRDRFALSAALQLPSLAAAELERKGEFSKQALAAAEHFALTDYLTALAGPPLQGDAAQKFYARVAAISGLPEEVVARHRGFIGDAYVKEFRHGEQKIVSHYDATFATDDPNPETPGAGGPDPILDVLTRSYGSAFASYAHDELGFKTDMTYNLLASDIGHRWKWGNGEPGVSEDMRVLLALTPSFRLMIAHGYSDMVTPFAVSRYVLDHLPAADGEGRTELKLYRGGHMFYLDPASRKAFTADARTMYASP